MNNHNVLPDSETSKIVKVKGINSLRSELILRKTSRISIKYPICLKSPFGKKTNSYLQYYMEVKRNTYIPTPT